MNNSIQEKQRRLLLIEDNAVLANLYKSALEEGGFVVTIAHGGEEGLAIAKAEAPDGILLDLLMPGMDGYEVLERLKSDNITRSIKVIVLTIVSVQEKLDHAISLGASECIVKSETSVAGIVERVNKCF